MSDLRASLIHLVSSDFSSQFGGPARSVARGGEMVPAGLLPFFRRAQIRRPPAAMGNFFMRGEAGAAGRLSSSLTAI